VFVLACVHMHMCVSEQERKKKMFSMESNRIISLPGKEDKAALIAFFP